jgi:hypothetical protein
LYSRFRVLLISIGSGASSQKKKVCCFLEL